MADNPGSARVISVEPGGYTVAVTYCECGAVVGECDCPAVVADWLRRFREMHRAGIAR